MFSFSIFGHTGQRTFDPGSWVALETDVFFCIFLCIFFCTLPRGYASKDKSSSCIAHGQNKWIDRNSYCPSLNWLYRIMYIIRPKIQNMQYNLFRPIAFVRIIEQQCDETGLMPARQQNKQKIFLKIIVAVNNCTCSCRYSVRFLVS